MRDLHRAVDRTETHETVLTYTRHRDGTIEVLDVHSQEIIDRDCEARWSHGDWKRGLPPGPYYPGMERDFEVGYTAGGVKWHRRRAMP